MLGHADAGKIPLSRPSSDSNQSLRTALQLFPVYQGIRGVRDPRAPACPHVHVNWSAAGEFSRTSRNQ
ncbi:hypothetical protein [Bradyrhizobium sp. 141]|uniref:hypothetical protein n=1 Tax=Bradyrhizobium sp. 141 TaxID=2782617 RepID=UPI001FF91131|nr:hypothetical protein [Bradyrhizobium sp. 141]MCK1723481.1 hypothetical protein [Bradyrhizobium sp. 141]